MARAQDRRGESQLGCGATNVAVLFGFGLDETIVFCVLHPFTVGLLSWAHCCYFLAPPLEFAGFYIKSWGLKVQLEDHFYVMFEKTDDGRKPYLSFTTLLSHSLYVNNNCMILHNDRLKMTPEHHCVDCLQ